MDKVIPTQNITEEYRDTPTNILRRYRDIPGLLKHNQAYRDRIKNIYATKNPVWKNFVEKDSYGLINDFKQRLINNITNKQNVNPLGGNMDGLGLYPPKLALTQYKNKVRFYDILMLLQDIYIDINKKKNKKSTYYYWLYNLPTDDAFIKTITSLMGLLVNNQSILDKRILNYPFKDKTGATKQFVTLWKAYTASLIPKNIVNGLKVFLTWVAKDLGLKTGTYTKEKYAKAQKYIKSKKQLWDLYDSIPAIRFIAKERSRASYLPIIYLGIIAKAYKTNKTAEFKKLITKYRAMIIGMWMTYPSALLKTVIRSLLGVDPKYAKDPANIKKIDTFYNTIKTMAIPTAQKKKVAKKNYVEKVANVLTNYIAKLPKKVPGSSSKIVIDPKTTKDAVNKTYIIVKPFISKTKDKDYTRFIMNVIAMIYKKIGVRNMNVWGRMVKRILLSSKAKQMASKAVMNLAKVFAESGLTDNQLLLAIMNQITRVPKNILKKEKAFNAFTNSVWVVTKKNPKNRASQQVIFTVMKDARTKLLADVLKRRAIKQGQNIIQSATGVNPSVNGMGWYRGCRRRGLGDDLGSCSCSNTARSVGDLSDTYNLYCDHVLWNPNNGRFYKPKKQRRRPQRQGTQQGQGFKQRQRRQPQSQQVITPGTKTDYIPQRTA